MVRNYVRKTKQASLNETSVKEAILAVKTKKWVSGKLLEHLMCQRIP